MTFIYHKISHNLLIFCTVCFACGIWLQGETIIISPQTVIIACLCLAIIFSVLKCLGARRLALFFLFSFCLSLGLVHGNNQNKTFSSTNHISQLVINQTDAVLISTLDEMPTFNGEFTTFVVKAQSLRLKSWPEFQSISGKIQLKLKDRISPGYLPGDRLVIRAKLNRPYRFNNPGGFDYPLYLREKNILVTGKVISPLHIYPLQETHSFADRLIYLPEKIRLKISTFLDQVLSPEIAGLYKAVLIGDRSGIDKDILEYFKRTGCMHILAISGLHMSILAAFLFAFCYWLLRRSEYLILSFPVKKLAAAFCLLPLFFYALLAGFNTPVIRSLIMVSVVTLGLSLNRRSSLFASLALAALIILSINPHSLSSASFLLSFSAVLSIAVCLPLLAELSGSGKKTATQIEKRRGWRAIAWRWMLAGMIISLAATIGTAPILLTFFNRISLIGPLANLLLEPLICFWALPVGFLAIPLIYFFPPAAESLFHFGAIGLKLSLKSSSLFAAVPMADIHLPTPVPLTIVFYYIALLALIYMKEMKLKIAAALLFSTTCFLLVYPPAELFKSSLKTSKITFLDVGQGSSTFIEFPGGKRVLIDGGGSFSSRFNVGEAVIAPYLWYFGIKKLNGIVITHSDADHHNGLEFIIKHFQPTTIWVNGFQGTSSSYGKLLQKAIKYGAEVIVPKAGTTLLSGGGARLLNLGNPITNSQSAEEISHYHSNEKGLIIRFSDKKLSCLFPGDINKYVERKLSQQNYPLKSTVLLSPHHGSNTSSSVEFLEAVNPEFVIVSASRFKKGYFPHPLVKKRLQKRGIPFIITADNGAITLVPGKEVERNVLLE